MGRTRMAQGVGAPVGKVDAQCIQASSNAIVKARMRNGAPRSLQRNEDFSALALGAYFLQVTDDRVADLARQRELLRLAAFRPPHGQNLAVPIDVFQAEP